MKKEISRPGLIKRLAVIVYDGLLLAGVLFFSLTILFGIPLYIFKSVTQQDTLDAYPGLKLFMSALLILVGLVIAFIFYGSFWTKGGQTLGMRAWHLYLVNEEGKYLSWKAAAIRFMASLVSWACVGMGFAWILISRKNLAWHDIATKTQIVKYKPVAEKKMSRKG